MVHYVVELPASPKPHGHSRTWGLFVDNFSMLSDVLHEIFGVDIVHIFPLHGVVPTVVAYLLPFCEAFGLVTPISNSIDDESSTSVYMAFSLSISFPHSLMETL